MSVETTGARAFRTMTTRRPFFKVAWRTSFAAVGGAAGACAMSRTLAKTDAASAKDDLDGFMPSPIVPREASEAPETRPGRTREAGRPASPAASEK